MKLSDISIHAWLDEHEIKTEAGKPYDLRDHLFWFDILKDWSPKQVWYKAAQVGGTISALYKVIYATKNFGLDVIYTMPSASDVRVLVKGKVNRILANNPVIKEWMDNTDSTDVKQIGDNLVYFRGTWTEQQAISVTADLNVHDEEDRSKADIIETYASRLDHSDHAWQWHFSNPSVLGNGVSKYWTKSDQKEWFIKCKHCNKEQYLKFPESICFERKIYQCYHCYEEITDEDRRTGRWVAKYKDREWSGYHISQMMVVWKSAKDIIEAYEEKPTDYFYNFVLGLPYVGEGNKLNKSQFMQNLITPSGKHKRVVIGCDSGKKKHYVIGDETGLFDYGMAYDWEDIGRLLVKYPQSIVVIDSAPDFTGPPMLQERFPNRVFLAYYFQGGKTMQTVRFGEKQEAGRVLVDRNRLLQQLVDEFTQGRIPVHGSQKGGS